MAVIDPSNRGLQLVTRYLVLSLIAIIFAFPLVFMLVSSLKPDDQLLRDTASLRAVAQAATPIVQQHLDRARQMTM